MSQLAIRVAILNVYMFALLCPGGEMAFVRNQAKWSISQSLLKTALFDFFSFKKSAAKSAGEGASSSQAPKNEAVASTVSAKPKPLRTLLVGWPQVQPEIVGLAPIPPVLAGLASFEQPLLPSPLELFEILLI